jgi:hypothetical protein
LKKNKKKTSNRNFIILAGLTVLFVVYRSYFKAETIGSDSRYLLFIFLIPTFLGIVILGFIKREFLKSQLKDAKGILQKGFLILLYIIQGFLFSYLSVGLFADVIWDNLNKKTADLNFTEIIDCKIAKINSGTSKTSPNIYFMLHGNYERLSIDHETYGKYYDTKIADLNLQITVRKGIWNYYILDEWTIINNR